MRWTQWPTSAVGFGRYFEYRPFVIAFQVFPPSSDRKAPAEEMATKSRDWFFGSMRIVWRHRPPAPGIHAEPVLCSRRPESSVQFWPPSVDLKIAASSTPA